MIDIHCHIIPAFDDGARDLEESMAIASSQSAGGTQRMIATPHVEHEKSIEQSQKIVDGAAMLNEQYRANGIAIEVIPGAELFPAMAILKGIDKGLPITLGGTGKYVLLDLPHSTLPHDFGTLIFELRARGLIPILAHPERCPVFKADPPKVREYLEKGAVLQLNSGSYTGRHGEQAEQTFEYLFKNRLAHFLASDAHRVGRSTLGSVVKDLSSEADDAYLNILTRVSPSAVLAGTNLPVLPEPVPVEEAKGLFSRLFSKLRTA